MGRPDKTAGRRGRLEEMGEGSCNCREEGRGRQHQHRGSDQVGMVEMGVCWGQDGRGRGFGLVVGWDMAAGRTGRLAGQGGWPDRAAGRTQWPGEQRRASWMVGFWLWSRIEGMIGRGIERGGGGGGQDKAAGGTARSRLVGWVLALEQARGDGWEGNREGGGQGGWRGWGVAGQGGWGDRTAGGTAWSRLVGWVLARKQDRGDGWEGDREGVRTGWPEGGGELAQGREAGAGPGKDGNRAAGREGIEGAGMGPEGTGGVLGGGGDAGRGLDWVLAGQECRQKTGGRC